jgi:hypothetical protein
LTLRSRISVNVDRNDEANTVAALTRATPIISAEADAEVRRGERPAFSRASTPGVLNSLATGQPSTLVTGRATVDDTLATPTNRSRAPPPARASMPMVPPGRPNSPSRNATMPTTVTAVPAISRFALSASNPSSGRIAATGGIFAARRAGTITDSNVMPTPTRNANTMVRGCSTVDVLGNPAPAELNTASRPRATSTPPPMPSSVATTDMISAST